MTFRDVLMECARNAKLVKEFDRLAGTALQQNKTPLDAEIDRVTGKEESDVRKFIDFVYEFIWLRCPRTE